MKSWHPRGWWRFVPPLKRFLRKPIGGQFTLVRTLLLVVRVRVALSILPYRVVRSRLMRKLARQHPRMLDDLARDQQVLRCAAEVRSTSRYVPAATCLTQAIAVQLLLHRAGICTDLRIGVARDAKSGAFRAHAWLDCDGVTIIGGELKGDFTTMPSAN